VGIGVILFATWMVSLFLGPAAWVITGVGTAVGVGLVVKTRKSEQANWRH
jgi:hypothetical protein